MKRKYNKPEIEVLDLTEDIMTETSASETDPFGDDDWEGSGL